MQLDQTQIDVREREMLDILDLSLKVLFSFARPLTLMFGLAALPLAVLNHLLIGWTADVTYDEQFPYTFMWNMFLLVLIEAPLASIFATCYLGRAVFLENPSWRQIMIDIGKALPSIAWCQLIVRAVLPVWLCFALIDRHAEYSPVAQTLIASIAALYCWMIRAWRPYVNEIIVLEESPLRASTDKAKLTVSRRSRMLHIPVAGDLLLRAISIAALSVMLWCCVYGAFLFVQGLLLGDWRQGWWMVHCCYPLSLWVVALFFTIARYLSYLDVRIRQEGWEVELRLRAEAAKLRSQLT